MEQFDPKETMKIFEQYAKEEKNRKAVESGFVCLDDVVSRSVEWLWRPYIPLGAVTFLEGDPGIGKSWATHKLAADLSSGNPLPDMPQIEPCSVLLLSAEDGLAETIKPRLESLNANSKLIFAPDGAFVLDDDGFTKLESLIEEYSPKLAIIDPLFSFMGGKIDIYRANQVRPFLGKLGELAQKYGLAILVVRHLTKGGRDKGLYRGVGAIDLSAFARSVLLVGVDPNDNNRRGIAHIKCNLAKLGPTYGYSLADGKFSWVGPIELTSNQMLAPEPIAKTSAVEDAKEFLNNFLIDGPRKSSEVAKAAGESGIKERTLNRAKDALQISAIHRGTPGIRGGGEWMWSLPDVPKKYGEIRTANTNENARK